MSDRTRALWMLVVANVCWGVSFPLIKAITMANSALVPEGSGAFATLYTIAPRFFIALAAMALWLRGSLFDITAAEWKRGTIVALFGAGGMILQNDGLRFTHASTSAFLTQFYAILIPVWLALRHGRNPPWMTWLCCILVLAGVAVLADIDYRNFSFGRGEIETLLSSVFFMGQILWVEGSARAGDRPVRITCVIFIVLAILFGIASAVAAPDAAALVTPWKDSGWLICTAVLGLFSTVGAFTLMMTWQPKITATEAGIVYCSEPVFAAALALFLPALISQLVGIDYPNERFTASLVVGGVLITGANLLLQLRTGEAGSGKR